MATRDLSHASNRARQWHYKIRIVIIRVRLAVAKIDHFIAGLAQLPGQILLRLKSSMIGGDTDAFGESA